jgi:hypothetical protein
MPSVKIMWYWRKENYEGLLGFANQIADEPELSDYANYCNLREKGLRKEAFISLNKFIESTRKWSLQQRYKFVDLIFQVEFENTGVYDLVPHPLNKFLFEPTLAEWVQVNPDDPSVYRWLGGENNWRKALLLDENDQVSLFRLVKRLIYNSYFSTHHLPEGYIGNPSEDMMELYEAQGLMHKIKDPDVQTAFLVELDNYKELVGNYLEFQKSNYVGNFGSWAILLGKRCQ